MKKQSTLPLVNATTYQLSYPNYSQSPRESLEAITSQNRDDFSNDLRHNDDHEEQIETIHLDEDSPRPQTPSQNDMKKASKTASVGRTPPRFDSIQINDDDYDRADNRRKETNYFSMNEEDDDTKARRIRELQNKLTRQEEESKKQIEELQTKQSRLENALKLIVKQTAYGKRSQQTNDDNNSKYMHYSYLHLMNDLFFILLFLILPCVFQPTIDDLSHFDVNIFFEITF